MSDTERLTKRISENIIELFARANPIQYNGSAQRVHIKHPFWNVFNKLCDYEDAEEQGLLLRLPCKIGDTVWSILSISGWYLRKKDAPYQAKIVFIGLNVSEGDNGGFFNVCYEKNTYMMSFRFSDIGKTVFLTKEEAEQAIARMEGADG